MSDLDEEFLPLPHFTWSERPSTIPLDIEETATALYLSEGDVDKAALRLKVHPLKIIRQIRHSPRLSRLHGELVSLLNNRVLMEYKRAFDDEDDRRREWASSKLAATAQFQEHPLAPISHGSSSTLAVAGPTRIVITWDDGVIDESPTLTSTSSLPTAG